MIDTAAAYAAGLIDGEGCVTFNHGVPEVPRPYILVANTSKAMTDWLLQNCGGTVKPRACIRDSRHKPAWQWQISGGAAVALLTRLSPFLRVKARQAAVLVELEAVKVATGCGRTGMPRKYPVGARQQMKVLSNLIRALNRRGPMVFD